MMRYFVKYFLRIFFGVEYLYFHYNIDEARKLGVVVGSNCRFIDTSPTSFSTEPYLIEIGNHVSMTRPRFVTHDGSVWIFRDNDPNIELFGRIFIGNNCFIGEGVIILPNTKVGNNCIIGAGTLLKGRYPDNSVIAGCPGRVISTVEEFYLKNSSRFTFFRNLDKKNKIASILKYV